MTLPIPSPRESGFTTTTPVPLYWAAYGRVGAPRLLVLHGGPGASHDYLLPQMLRLAERYDVLFYDQRGGGRSRGDDRAPVTWRTHADDVGAVVRELALDRDPLRIVGYSWGGMLAVLYALVAKTGGGRGVAGGADQFSTPHPPPVALALIDPAPLTRAYREAFEGAFAARSVGDAVRRLREELAASGLRERDPEGYRQRNFELSVAGYFADPARAHDLTPFRVVGRVQQQVWESLGDFDLVRDIADARLAGSVASLVVHGRQDPIPLASSEEGARALGARLVVIENSGHVPYVEQPTALFAALGEFLAATDPSPSSSA
jgi:proline iminopeptidase